MTLAGSPPSAEACPWLCEPPTGPSHPFGDSALIVFDTLRIVCFVSAAVALVLTVIIVAGGARATGQKVRFVAFLGLGLVAVLTEVEHFGDYANLRLVVATASLMSMAWGCYAAIRFESPAKPRWHGKT